PNVTIDANMAGVTLCGRGAGSPRIGRQVSMSDYDAIIIGAGHNGLVAANVLAKNGAKVLVLERAHFLGGMAATRELFDGYKHSVGAWAVLIWRQEMTERLELPNSGFDLMDQWTSPCTFGDAQDSPFVIYN